MQATWKQERIEINVKSTREEMQEFVKYGNSLEEGKERQFRRNEKQPKEDDERIQEGRN